MGEFDHTVRQDRTNGCNTESNDLDARRQKKERKRTVEKKRTGNLGQKYDEQQQTEKNGGSLQMAYVTPSPGKV